jgi:hypothetical protein
MDTKSVHQLNALAHAARKAGGELGGGLMLRTLDCRQGELVEMSVNDLVVFWSRDTPAGIARRREGTLLKIHGAVIRVQTRDTLVDIDTTDEKWQRKRGCLALAHGYAATVLSSRALTVDRAWLKDALALRRTTSGIAMSRHRDSCQVHVDMRARYEARMQETPADQWHPLEEFSTDECLTQMARDWSAEQEKNATVDFAKWEMGGARVDVPLEVRIQRVTDKKDQRIQEKAAQTSSAVSDRKQAWPEKRLGEKLLRRHPFVAPGNALGHALGFKTTVESPTGRLRALRKKPESLESLKNLMPPVASSEPMLPMPFQQMPTPRRQGPQASEMVTHQVIHQAIDRLPAEKIDADGPPQGAGHGAMAFGAGGQTVVYEGLPDDLDKADEHSMPMGGDAAQDAWAVFEEAEPEPEQELSQPQDSPC